MCLEDFKLTLIPDRIQQGSSEEEIRNTLTIRINYMNNETIDFNKTNVFIRLPCGSEDDDLILQGKEKLVHALCSQATITCEKLIEGSFVLWQLRSQKAIASGTCFDIVIKDLICPIQEDEVSCMSYLQWKVEKQIAIYPLLKLRNVKLEIYEWKLEGGMQEGGDQVDFGADITLRWNTNAYICVVYPYGIRVDSMGEYHMKVYEDTCFTLHAIKGDIHETKTLSITVVNSTPIIDSFSITTKNCMTFCYDYSGTSYAYISKSIGRVETKKQAVTPLFCNQTGFQLSLLSGKTTADVKATAIGGGEYLIELAFLSYTMSIQNNEFVYYVTWVLDNCDDVLVSINRIDAFGNWIKISRTATGSADFKTDTSWISSLCIHVKSKDGKCLYHINEVYPWNPWDEKGGRYHVANK